MTDSAADARLRWGTLAVVLGVAALASLWGLTARDLTGDERALDAWLYGVLAHSYAPSSPEDFSAHLPLFGLVRALFLTVLPEGPLGRRLPAALLTIASAGAHWWLFARERRWRAALFAGLALALHPLASFYAHDSSNYALSPLCVAFVLAGLADLRASRERGALWLGLGLILGTFSDFFFAFVVTAALVGTRWVVRREAPLRRAVLKAWGALVAVQAIPAAIFLWHISRFPGSDFMAPHADAAGGDALDPWVALGRHGTSFVSSYFEGYHRFGEGDPILAVLAGALLLLGVARGLRGRPVEQVAALLLVAVLGQMLAAGFVFTALTGHYAPLAVRSHMVLLSPLVVVWTAALASPGRGRSLATVGAVCLVAALGVRTAWQLAHPAATRQPIADRVVERWQDGDELVSIYLLHDRLPDGFPGRSDVAPCLPDDSEATRLWIVGDPGSTWPDTIARCGGGEPLLDAGWAMSYAEHQPIPFYEWDSGSFLVGTALYLFERKPLRAWPWPPARFQVTNPPADRQVEVRWRVSDTDADDVVRLPVEAEVELPPFVDGAERLEITYRLPSDEPLEWLAVEPAGHGGLRMTTGPASGPAVWTDAPSLVLSQGASSHRAALGARRVLAALAVLGALAGMALGRRRE